MIKVLFVCHGNICRSPLGEFIMKDLAIKAGYTVKGINRKDAHVSSGGGASSHADSHGIASSCVASVGGAVSSVASADFEIESAATSTEELGNPIYPPSLESLLEHGIGTPENELGVKNKRARQITKSDYDYYDYIICMDRNNIRNALRIFGKDPDEKLRLMLEYAGRLGEEVADPWYTRNFDETWNDVFTGCQGLLKKLEND